MVSCFKIDKKSELGIAVMNYITEQEKVRPLIAKFLSKFLKEGVFPFKHLEIQNDFFIAGGRSLYVNKNILSKESLKYFAKLCGEPFIHLKKNSKLHKKYLEVIGDKYLIHKPLLGFIVKLQGQLKYNYAIDTEDNLYVIFEYIDREDYNYFKNLPFVEVLDSSCRVEFSAKY